MTEEREPGTETRDPERGFGNRGFTVVLIAVAAWGAATSLHWREEVRLAPLVTSLTFGALALAQLLWAEVRGLLGRGCATAPEDAPGENHAAFGDEPASGAVAWRGVAWCGAAVMSVVLFGIVVGLPAGVLLLCAFAFRERLAVTLLAVAVTALTILIFDQVFNVVWPVGLVADALG